MRAVVLVVAALLASGCASAPRMQSLVDMSEQGSAEVVVKSHDQPVMALYDQSSTVTAALGVNFGFVGGFVGSLIDSAIFDGRDERAQKRIEALREKWGANEIDRLVVDAFRQSFDSNPGASASEIDVVYPEVKSWTGSGKRELESRRFPDDKTFLGEQGITLIVSPVVAMSRNVDVLHVELSITGYTNRNSRRVYHITLGCEVAIEYPLKAREYLELWKRNDVELLDSQLNTCMNKIVALFFANAYEGRRFAHKTREAARIAKDPHARIPRGTFEGFDIFEVRDQGYVLARSLDAGPVMWSDEGMVDYSDERMVKRIESNDPEVIQRSMRYIEKHSIDSEPVFDALATYLWSLRFTTDYEQVRLAVDICDFLTDNGNPRYRSLLEQVSKDANHRWIVSKSRKAARALAAEGVAQFQVDEVSAP